MMRTVPTRRNILITTLALPTLRAGQVVILDNLSVDRRARVAQLIPARDWELWFLPGDSPAWSPIEHAFAKFKQALRRVGARTLDVLYEAIDQALPSISPHDALGFFLACSYPPRAARATSLCTPLQKKRPRTEACVRTLKYRMELLLSGVT